MEIGSCRCQQAAEALAALVACRLWLPNFAQQRIVLHVTGDSVTMLTLVLHLRPASKSVSLGIIARELALDVAMCEYAPDVAEHVPGIANLLPDALSRRYDPDKVWTTPDAVQHVPEAVAPERNHSFYRSLFLPDIRAGHSSSGTDWGVLPDDAYQ